MRPTLALVAALAVVALAPAGAQALSTASFRTPTGNIRCAQFGTLLRCDLMRIDNRPPARPRSCEFDYGQSFGLSPRSRRGKRLCVSDAIDRPTHVLRYGRHWRRRGLHCFSRRTGLTCKNAKGHGFFVSRRSQRTF